MVKEFKSLKIQIDDIKHGKKCNVITINENLFNESQYNAISKQYKKLGFINCTYKFKNEDVDIYYDTTNLISVNQYFSQNDNVTETEFIGILKTICQSIKSCSNYIYFSESNFALDGDLLYIDTKDRSIHIMYTPINRPLSENIVNDIKNLIRDLVNNKLKIKKGEKNFTQGILEELRNDSLEISDFLSFLTYSIEANTSNNVNNNQYNIDKISNDLFEKAMSIEKTESKLEKKELVTIDERKISHLESIEIENSNTSNFKNKKGLFRKLFSTKKENVSKSNSKNTFNKKNIISDNFDDETYDTIVLKDVKLNEKIVYLISAQDNQKIEINKDIFIIGRLKNSVDYDIANGAVGKIHSKIITKNNKYYIQDMESKNGTFINNTKLNHSSLYELNDGDLVKFANAEYVFKIQK